MTIELGKNGPLFETTTSGMTYRQWLVGLAMQGDLTNGMPKEQSTIAEFAKVWCMVADAAIKAERETREATAKEASPVPDLDRCPSCGGPADNGNDRLIPPNPYVCNKCCAKYARAGG